MFDTLSWLSFIRAGRDELCSRGFQLVSQLYGPFVQEILWVG